MSEIRKRLLELNPELFSMRQPSKEHDVLVIGRKKDKDGTVVVEYLLRSKPSEAAKKAGVKVSDLIHAAFMPTGAVKQGEDGKRSYQGPKKARVGVVFLNTQPNLYNFLKEGIEEGEEKGYKKAGTDAQKRPMIKMRDTVYGLKITILTDLYNPHSIDPADGKLKPLMATTFKPSTGEYKKEKVTIGSYTFFADDDDLDNLLEICTRHYQKNVAPYVTEKTTVIKETGTKKTVEVKETEIVGPENDENEPEEPDTE